VFEQVATASGGYLTAYAAGDDWEVNGGEKVQVTEGTVPCSRELSSYTTHQALSLAILYCFSPWTWARWPMDCVHGGEHPCKWQHID